MNFFSNRAFAAFTVALAASMWALFTDIGRPYLPSVPIVVYTLYLYANRSAVGQLGGDALKDSPYFLGFLLTMFALFKIFNDVSFSSNLFGQNPALMTQEVGGAVLTTIVGLFCRQALLALVQDEAPEEDDRLAALANAVTSHAVAFEVARQHFFREMSDERARQTEELKATQDRFLAELAAASAIRSGQSAATAAANSATGEVLGVSNAPMASPNASRPSPAELTVTPEVAAIPASGSDLARTLPYAGPSAFATPTSSPINTPPGPVPAVAAGSAGSAGSANSPSGSPLAGPSGSLPPYPPYLGQGRASNTTRSEE